MQVGLYRAQFLDDVARDLDAQLQVLNRDALVDAVDAVELFRVDSPRPGAGS